MFSMSHCAPGDAYYLQETGIKSAAAGFGKAAFGLRGGFARANAGGADEQFGRDLQMLVQAANHLQRQRAASAQDLVDAGPAADDSRERFCIRPPLLQAKLDRLDGVLRINVKMSALIGLHQVDQNLQPVPFESAVASAPQALDFGERLVMVFPRYLIGSICIARRAGQVYGVLRPEDGRERA